MAKKKRHGLTVTDLVLLLAIVRLGIDPEGTNNRGNPWSDEAKALIYKAKSLDYGDTIEFIP